MSQTAPSFNLLVAAVSFVVVGLYFLTCYAVARYWRLNRKRSLTAGWILSFFLTPLVGWLVGSLLEPDPAVLERDGLKAGTMKTCPECAESLKVGARVCRYCGASQPEPATSLHDVLQQTYREVDEKRHAHS